MRRTTFEILILVLTSTLLVFMVVNTRGKEMKPSKLNEKNYVQFVTSKPILSMPSANVEFDGDVYFASDLSWDWNDSHQQPSRNPALYLADPFINIQNAHGEFQPMF